MKQDQTDMTLEPKSSSGAKKLGIVLVVLSSLLYGGILIVPFLPYSAVKKAAICTGLAVVGEITFWFGALILGREIITRYKEKLNPLRWFKK